MAPKEFKFSYATMFNPPEEMHTRFEEGLAHVKASLGKEYGMIIDGKDYFSAEKFEKRSPVNTDVVLGVFQKGTAERCRCCVESCPQGLPGLEPHEMGRPRRTDPQGSMRSGTGACTRSARPWPWKQARTAWSPWVMSQRCPP